MLSVREQITQTRRKGTTKNAHTQAKRAFFLKKWINPYLKKRNYIRDDTITKLE